MRLKTCYMRFVVPIYVFYAVQFQAQIAFYNKIRKIRQQISRYKRQIQDEYICSTKKVGFVSRKAVL